MESTIKLRSGAIMERRAWTGGTVPPVAANTDDFYYRFREIRREYFREQLRECGGLDLWKCAGTGSVERARILWKRATLDAWRTFMAQF